MNISDCSHKVINNQTCHRLIPSRFPPISLFEDVANENDFDVLYEIQAITNPRIQEMTGNLNLVPSEQRVYGSGAGYIMAPFTHLNPDGSRFSNGDYGIYYASEKLDVAIAETKYHRGKFMSYTNEPPQEIDMRHLISKFSSYLYDITPNKYIDDPIYDENSYRAGQMFGLAVKNNQGDGIVYNSVRTIGVNFALFKPNLIRECTQASHYGYIWDGEKISNIYRKVIIQ